MKIQLYLFVNYEFVIKFVLDNLKGRELSSDSKKWILWRDGDRAPAMNMALDELLLEKSEILCGKILLRIYGWDCPSISIGYTQHYSSVQEEALKYSIVRRPTGGGIVYHDRDLTYTIIVPAGHPIEKLDRVESYHIFHRAILRTMRFFNLEGTLSSAQANVTERAAMRCFATPTKYDVLSGTRKMAGAAQRRTKKGILHQGSISLEVSRGNAGQLRTFLKQGFAEEFCIDFEKFIPEDDFLGKACNLSVAKFATDEWNKSR